VSHFIQFLLSLIFLDSILLTNHLVYSQLLTGTQDHATSISPPATLPQHTTKLNLHLVKITSPHKGQHVSVTDMGKGFGPVLLRALLPSRWSICLERSSKMGIQEHQTSY
jgi:hypothetical protein